MLEPPPFTNSETGREREKAGGSNSTCMVNVLHNVLPACRSLAVSQITGAGLAKLAEALPQSRLTKL